MKKEMKGLVKDKKEMRSFLPKNKKGAEMTIGTIIIIVLALIVLVILVYGFSTGWSNLWEKIVGFGGGEVNVQSVIQSCQLSCTTGSRYDYCIMQRGVTFEDKDKSKDYNCDELSKEPGLGLSCPAIKCDTGENCEKINDRNERLTGVKRCPAGTALKPSADTTPLAGAEREAWCCQSKSLDAAQQKIAKDADCNAITSATICADAQCTPSECTLSPI